jgi:hypothetical protein
MLYYSARHRQKCSDKGAIMLNTDFSDPRFILLVVMAFVVGLFGSLAELAGVLPLG